MSVSDSLSSLVKKNYDEAVKLVATQSQPPLLKARPSRMIRWGWWLVGGNIIFCLNAAHFAWKYSTIQVEEPPAPKTPKSRTPAAAATPEVNAAPADETKPIFELRPVWQRAGFAAAFLVASVGCTWAILGARARTIRTLTLAPRTADLAAHPKNTKQFLFMQTFSHDNTEGLLVPLEKCSLRVGRTPSEMVFDIEGKKGAWTLELEKATLNGQPVKKAIEAQDGLLNEWRTVEKKVVKVDSRWKKGPIKQHR